MFTQKRCQRCVPLSPFTFDFRLCAVLSFVGFWLASISSLLWIKCTSGRTLSRCQTNIILVHPWQLNCILCFYRTTCPWLPLFYLCCRRTHSQQHHSINSGPFPRCLTPCTVSVCCSWWGPVLTSSVWCPSWCLSSSPSWSSFFPSSSNCSLRCCPPPLRRSPKRHAHTHTHTHTLLSEWTYNRVHWDYKTSQTGLQQAADLI